MNIATFYQKRFDVGFISQNVNVGRHMFLLAFSVMNAIDNVHLFYKNM